MWPSAVCVILLPCVWVGVCPPQLFENPDAISRQLLCVICGGVLENPVQTPCEHLFWYVARRTFCAAVCARANATVPLGAAHCSESELLEWCVRELKCPMDNLPLDVAKVTKPRCGGAG